MSKKCIVLFSNGLDSRLAVKVMQKQSFEVIGLFFKLPFSKDISNEAELFAKEQSFKLIIFDCTKGKLLKEYLEMLKKPKYGYGSGINPCIDCKIFILKKAKEFAKKHKINVIATGEVLGERPMSQMRNSMKIIEEKSGLRGKLLRPLSAKLLEETEAEKKHLVKRSELFDIHGRKRDMQIFLAKKFKINYPSPGGGCLLCEKNLVCRFNYILNRGLNDEEAPLINLGRHFLIDDCWVVLGRNKKENEVIENLKIGEKIVPDFIGPSAIILNKCNKKIKKKVNLLIIAYAKKGSLLERKKFDKFKL